MKATDLAKHPAVLRLTEIQQELDLKDIPFAKHLRFPMHGANWGKIKRGNYHGTVSSALASLIAILDEFERGRASGRVEDGILVLDHVQQTKDAVEVAKASNDEHRLVLIVGVRGSGKTRTLSLIRSLNDGYTMSAMPSWSGSYLNFLNNFAAAIGLGHSRSAGEAETTILNLLKSTTPGVITIDEFNHFSAAAINFLKAVMNETRWVILAATIPHHLSRMASDRSTSQEAVQFVRRAVAIVHILPVSVLAVEQFQGAFYPDLRLGDHASAIATIANKIHRIDSVAQILDDSAGTDDIPAAIARHKLATAITLSPAA